MEARLELVDAAPALEQAADLRRSVLCGELHLSRAVVDDGLDLGPACRLLLAWDGEKPVGTARLRLDDGAALLEHLAVLPSHRRRGLGRRLAAELMRLAREAGRPELLCVAPASADPFFYACGFVHLKRDADLVVWRSALD